MKIYLAHSNQIKYSNYDWIYLGTSFKKLHDLESILDGQRISIPVEIHKQANIQKNIYLKWLELHRKKNKDSIYWWTSHLASRNNLVSKFFIYILQIISVIEFCKKTDKKYLLIVCENSFLMNSIKENLSIYHNCEYFTKWRINLFFEISYLLLRAFYTKFRSLKFFIFHYIFARITKPKNLQKPRGEIYLFHHCLDTNYFNNNDKFSCRYFTILPDWLQKKKKNVYGLPWFFNINLPLRQTYKKLRNSSCFIPEDWLTLKDYISAILGSFKVAMLLDNKISYPNLNLKSLILQERLIQLGESSELFLRYLPSIYRWGKDIKKLIVYDHYENMIFEHPLRYAIKQMPIETFSIGYYHSLVSKEWMPYHSIPSEWQSLIKPDKIICNGKKAFNILLSQGVPKDKLLIGSALRQNLNLINHQKNKNNKLLILASLSMESNVEILSKIFKVFSNNKININVTIKSHPMFNKNKILKVMKWQKLPFNWEWENKEITEALQDSYCCLTMTSAACYDAILSGSIVLPIMSELSIGENYLDLYQDQYPIISSVESEKIYERLKDIFEEKNDFYESEFAKLRKDIIKDICPINDENLNTFIV